MKETTKILPILGRCIVSLFLFKQFRLFSHQNEKLKWGLNVENINVEKSKILKSKIQNSFFNVKNVVSRKKDINVKLIMNINIETKKGNNVERNREY